MKEIEALAKKLLENDWIIDYKSYNLKELGWIFKFNKRKKSLGMCNAKLKYISLSEHFVKINNTNKEIWNDTIKHEVAHAIDFEIRNYSDHSDTWKNIAKQVGCEPENYSDNTLILPDGKYTLKCKTCGLEQTAHRRKKNKVACAKCCIKHNNGKFSSKYILDIIVNF